MTLADAFGAQPARKPIRLGSLVLAPCLLLFTLIACFVPLSVAAVSNGELVVELKRRTVQHLEGGIVERVLVREGEAVQENTPLIVIADVQQRAQIHALVEKIANATALKSRIQAELTGDEGPHFHDLDSLVGLTSERRDALVQLHTGILRARTEGLASKLNLIRSQQQQAEIEMKASETNKGLLLQKHKLSQQEHDGVEALYAKNHATLTKKLELERLLLDLESQIEAASFASMKAAQAISSAELEYANTVADSRKTALEELQSAEVSLQDWSAMLAGLRDDVRRRTVRAPVRGRVMDLQVHTEGAVVGPGGRILDVVPDNERVIVDARVNPNDIDIVHPGVSAKIVLTGIKLKGSRSSTARSSVCRRTCSQTQYAENVIIWQRSRWTRLL